MIDYHLVMWRGTKRLIKGHEAAPSVTSRPPRARVHTEEVRTT